VRGRDRGDVRKGSLDEPPMIYAHEVPYGKGQSIRGLTHVTKRKRSKLKPKRQLRLGGRVGAAMLKWSSEENPWLGMTVSPQRKGAGVEI